MSAVATIIASIASKVGADLIGNVLGDRFGPAGGQLAEVVIGEVAGHLGVTPEALPEVPHADLEGAVKDIEARMPELIALWSRGLDGQFAMLQGEQKEGGLASGWRWGWMYLLGFFWVWVIVIVPLANAATGGRIEVIDFAILLTLTSWFIALYMGGHTVKELGKNAMDAIKAVRGGR